MLFLCNGHGEDLITLRIIQAVHRRAPRLSLSVLPLVGTGRVFDAAVQQGWLTRMGPKAALPSGGFSNQSLRGLVSDLSAGLPTLSWTQWRLVRRLGHNHQPIVAVGDLLPLLMAWSSGSPFGFIGTPKSDYTWRSGPGRARSDCYHLLKGSEWDPWEWSLMRSRRCRVVAMRDCLTARGLRRKGVDALAPGNPMMDGLRIHPLPSALERCRRVLLLCGSRMPEAQRNLQRLVRSAMSLPGLVPMALLVAVGAQPDASALSNSLEQLGFRRSLPPSDQLRAEACWVKGACLVLIGRGCFDQWAGWAEAGIATAGTATEQLVGLGIPALSLPGSGPQFKQGFARRQSRLLGGAVRPCSGEAELTARLEQLLDDPEKRTRLGRIGVQRMGPAGGSDQLARLILDRFNGY
ncbi:lipid-A-disaccharide synthase-related protein [Synechococcus sp. PROS-U-1]|uniref:lipid-A-disaccharide synthase-related protein n=1 Tax=Synechococcus sp. PROS-U-1 TaxID=1400866 RepID=UPI0016449C9B|nr:lipid-A-disaccharide synthase-related protein [Synechococcus sp. PROS-U-1]